MSLVLARSSYRRGAGGCLRASAVPPKANGLGIDTDQGHPLLAADADADADADAAHAHRAAGRCVVLAVQGIGAGWWDAGRMAPEQG